MAMRVLGGDDGFRPLFVSPTAPQEPPPPPNVFARAIPRDTADLPPRHAVSRPETRRDPRAGGGRRSCALGTVADCGGQAGAEGVY